MPDKKTPAKTHLKIGPGRLTADNQPSAELKKAGRERRRQAQRIMDKILELQGMPFSELANMMKKENLGDMTAADVICLRYVNDVMKGKLIVDFLNRHISYAPQDYNIGTSEDIQEIKIKVTKVNNNKK